MYPPDLKNYLSLNYLLPISYLTYLLPYLSLNYLLPISYLSLPAVLRCYSQVNSALQMLPTSAGLGRGLQVIDQLKIKVTANTLCLP